MRKAKTLGLIESSLQLIASHSKGSEWDIVVIKAGLSKNRTYYTEDALRNSVKLFENAKVCAYGFNPEQNEHVPDAARDKAPGGFVKNIVGFLKNAKFDESRKAIVARLHISENAKWMRNLFLDMKANGNLDALGFSIDAKGQATMAVIEGEKVAKVMVIESVLELTVVTHPAAGGKALRLVASIGKEDLPLAILATIKESLPDWIKGFDLTEAKKEGALDLVTQIIETNKDRAVVELGKITPKEESFLEAADTVAKLQAIMAHIAEGKLDEAMAMIREMIAAMKKEEEPAPAPAPEPKEEPPIQEATKLGDRIRELREKAEMSSEELAQSMGIEPNTLTQIESGEIKRPPDDKLRAAARALNVSFESLLNLIPEEIREPASEHQEAENMKQDERTTKLEKQLAEMRSENVLTRVLGKSDLPDAAQTRVRGLFEGREATANKVYDAVKAEKDYLATLTKSGDVTNCGGRKDDVRVTEDQREKYGKAMYGMLIGEDVDGVPQFPGIHDSYRIIHGFNGPREAMARRIMVSMAASSPDLGVAEWGKEQRREEHFKHLRESARLYPIDLKEVLLTTTWAEVFGDSIRRALIRAYSADMFDIWRKVVSDTPPIQDFRTHRRVRVGGFADLATVAENAAYADFANPGDEEVTYTPTKKGNLFPVTWEAMLQDDLGRLRQIPRDIGRTAGRTLAKDVLVTNLMANPVIFDAVALVAGAHNNNQTAALSNDTLQIAIQQMRKQTELTSGERLSIVPRFLLVPPDLEDLAFELTASRVKVTAGEDSTVANSLKDQFRIQPIVVPWQTDVNDWFLVADPTQNPTIEVGFLGGRQTPEIFVQEANNLGAVFTNDRITWKVRFAWGIAVLDFRTFSGSLVA